MALKRTLLSSHRSMFAVSRISTAATCRISSPCTAARSKIPANPDPGDAGIFRRHLHRHSSSAAPLEPRFLPTGEALLQKLRDIDIARNRARLDGLIPPAAHSPEEEESPAVEAAGLTVKDAVKILKLTQLEAVKARLKREERDCVTYAEFLEMCGKECGSADQGTEFAGMLDQSGCVIVLGKMVYLRPEQVVKAIQGLIPLPKRSPIDGPTMKELQELEKQKTAIDREARFLVRRELWGGLGYLVAQTAVFMRLTFWELSWDVMEPICFYVTSLYFILGYTFFLRTSKEPSFEGFFQSRFSAKQKRLIKARNFDIERYNELKTAYSMREDNAVKFSSSSPVVC